jgi:hypothetical protein
MERQEWPHSPRVENLLKNCRKSETLTYINVFLSIRAHIQNKLLLTLVWHECRTLKEENIKITKKAWQYFENQDSRLD